MGGRAAGSGWQIRPPLGKRKYLVLGFGGRGAHDRTRGVQIEGAYVI